MAELVVGALLVLGSSVAGIAFGQRLEAKAEAQRRIDDRATYLRERREAAYLDWLTAVPQLATAFFHHRQGVRDRALDETMCSAEEVDARERVVRDLDIGTVRPALNQVRLVGSADIVNKTRHAFGLLIEADVACEHGMSSDGQLELEDYQAAFSGCLKQMREDLGTSREGEQLEPAGGANREAIRKRLLAEKKKSDAANARNE
jgi:hypothetical protein